MHYSKIAGILTGAALALLTLTTGVSAADGEVVVNDLNIRSGPSTESAIVGKVNAGEILKVTGNAANRFYTLNYNGSAAYASIEYVALVPVGKGTVNTDVLNMRNLNTTDAEIIDKLTYGESVTILEDFGGWYQINRYGVIGYVSSDYVTVSTGYLASRSGSSGKGLDVVRFGEKYLGVPYVSGGSSPSGFDCSGFTSYVYRNFGISLPRTAAGQAGQGIEVSRGNIQAGDLLFFNTYGGISHVGIAVNSDTFIHATVPGDVVKYSNLNSAYYSSRFVTARRVLR